MQFSGEELSAVMKMAITMVGADGRSDEREMEVVRNELTRFGASVGQMLALTKEAQKMEFQRAIEIISNFNYEKKTYVSSFLAIIMIADDEINDKEVALWQLVSALCRLPEMNISQAIDKMNKF